jgi:hypothetical protein
MCTYACAGRMECMHDCEMQHTSMGRKIKNRNQTTKRGLLKPTLTAIITNTYTHTQIKAQNETCKMDFNRVHSSHIQTNTYTKIKKHKSDL